MSSDEKGELVKQLGAKDFINRNEFAGMMRKGGETPDRRRNGSESHERSGSASRRSSATRPTSCSSTSARRRSRHRVFVVKPFGKVVICGATSGYNLDFDVRYLWMRQKQIIGSHFANAWEATKANELIAQSKIRPVLWRVMPFEGVAEAHQLMRENKHQGKIAILVGADSEGQGKTAEGPGAIRAEVGN